MLTIRLTRKGKKNQPFFKVVVIDKRRSSKGGRAVEVLGYVDPLTKKRSLKKERVLYWISKGAKPSATVNNLLIKENVIEGKIIHVSKISKKRQVVIDAAKVATAPVAAPSPVEVPSEMAAEISPVTEPSSAKASEGQGEKLIEEPKDLPAQSGEIKPVEEKDEQK